MNQAKYSHTDFKQETLFLREDSQIPIPGDSTQSKTSELYELLNLNFKTYSFIVDWQLSEIEFSKVDKPYS